MQLLRSSSRLHPTSHSIRRPTALRLKLFKECGLERSLASNSAAMPTAQQETCSGLWARVTEVYASAQAIGAATKTETKVQVFEDAGIAFVLRIASALKSKPKGIAGTPPPAANQQEQQPPPAVRNPFLPYEEELWCQHLSDTHTLLLNKFNVVPHHVLVVTRQFESQQDPLNSRDLAATQQVLAAMPQGGVAFYNCGAFSGRSQPHKHLQIVPLPFNENDATQKQQQQQQFSPAQPPIQPVVLAAQAAANALPLQPFPLRQLPYRAYAVVLDQSTIAEQLETAAGQLLQLCQAGLPEPVSYNAVITRDFMLMVPRSREMSGPIGINSLGYAGTVLLRSEEDLAYAVQQRPLHILAEVGQPWSSEPEPKM